MYPIFVFSDQKLFLLGHIGFALLILYSGLAKKRADAGASPYLELIMLGLGLGSVLYMLLQAERLQLRGEFFWSRTDIAVAVCFLGSVLYGVKRNYGWTLPIVTLVCVSYALLGGFIPGELKGSVLTFPVLMAKLVTSLGDQGVFGIILKVSALYVFLFLVFGSIVQISGVTRFFELFGNLVARKFKAGPALATVISCGLMGSLTGQVGSDIAIIGSYAVPSMRRAGYSNEQIAAILAAAGTAGPIVPPVLGIVAFIMAGITGIPYPKIAAAAVIPALLYVFSVSAAVELEARKTRPHYSPNGQVDLKELALFGGMFGFGVAIIVYLFVKGFPPMTVAFWATILMIGATACTKRTRLNAIKLLDAFREASKLGSEIALTCALLGVLVGVMEITGLAMKLPIFVEAAFAGTLPLLLIMAALVAIVLGMGMPASAAYILVALIMCPTLLKFGLSVLSAHYFAYYFANFSFLTPPVALAALFASRLTGADYFKTGLKACKYGLSAFIIPFFFPWSQAVLGDFSTGVKGLLEVLTSFLVLTSVQNAISGLGRLHKKLVLVGTAVFGFGFLVTDQLIFFVLAFALGLSVLLWSLRTSKIQKAEYVR